MPRDAATGVLYIAPSPCKKSPTVSPTSSEFCTQPLNQPTLAPNQPSILKSLLFLLPILTIWPWWCKNLHYDLPTPVTNGSPANGSPVLSELNIINHVQRLEDIGYRIIGTDEAVDGEQYVYDVMQGLLEQCDRSNVLECSLWMQEGDGMHQFDIMSHAVLKSYRGIRNVIFRVAGIHTTTTLEGQAMKNCVLLNSHIDSALPSKGSADDGLGVGVMAEIARVLVERDQHITGGVIFLFNGAEESLQDASHLYSTQHETRHEVKTVINLEAAGTTGGAVLFQATAQEMVDAYSHVPRPHGNVIALEVFQSGIIMSDTDFRQFEQYLDVPGLDLSLVGNSYFYHTRRDTVENIEVGAAQHFGDTVLAVLDHLLQPGSPLNTDTPWTPLDSVFYSLYDRVYVQYSMRTGDVLCMAFLVAFIALFTARTQVSHRSVYYKAMVVPIADFAVGLLAAISTAVLLRYGLKKGQSWFTHEQLPLVVFGLPVLSAIALRHYFFAPRSVDSSTTAGIAQHAYAYATVMHALGVSAILQCLRIKSAYMFYNIGAAGLCILIVNEAINIFNNKVGSVYFIPTYMIWTAISIFFGVEAITAFLDIFVPLVGRMGRDAPGEVIVAVISAFLTHNFLPMIAPFFHRFTREQQRQIVISLLCASSLIIAVFASPAWKSYDATHPKRTGVQWMYNTSSAETTLHVAQLDSGPGYAEFVEKIHRKYGFADQPPVKGGPEQWDILYPVSAFIESENFPIVSNSSGTGMDLPELTIKLVSDRFDVQSGYRTMTIEVSHEGILTPVLSFSAEVITWSFRIAPPVGHLRHYVKANASPGSATFQMVMTVKPAINMDNHRLAISYMGIDKRQLFPGVSQRYPGLAANDLFANMDAWIEEEWNGSMEVLMYGGICGIVEV